MLYRFNSRATSSFVMLEAHARWLLEVIGKTAAPKGIITVEQIPAAIEALEAAMALEARNAHDGGDTAEGCGDEEGNQRIGIRQRGAPLLRMLKESLADKKDVTWTV
jgi:hypothetical protein